MICRDALSYPQLIHCFGIINHEIRLFWYIKDLSFETKEIIWELIFCFKRRVIWMVINTIK